MGPGGGVDGDEEAFGEAEEEEVGGFDPALDGEGGREDGVEIERFAEGLGGEAVRRELVEEVGLDVEDEEAAADDVRGRSGVDGCEGPQRRVARRRLRPAGVRRRRGQEEQVPEPPVRVTASGGRKVLERHVPAAAAGEGQRDAPAPAAVAQGALGAAQPFPRDVAVTARRKAPSLGQSPALDGRRDVRLGGVAPIKGGVGLDFPRHRELQGRRVQGERAVELGDEGQHVRAELLEAAGRVLERHRRAAAAPDSRHHASGPAVPAPPMLFGIAERVVQLRQHAAVHRSLEQPAQRHDAARLARPVRPLRRQRPQSREQLWPPPRAPLVLLFFFLLGFGVVVVVRVVVVVVFFCHHDLDLAAFDLLVLTAVTRRVVSGIFLVGGALVVVDVEDDDVVALRVGDEVFFGRREDGTPHVQVGRGVGLEDRRHGRKARPRRVVGDHAVEAARRSVAGAAAAADHDDEQQYDDHGAALAVVRERGVAAPRSLRGRRREAVHEGPVGARCARDDGVVRRGPVAAAGAETHLGAEELVRNACERRLDLRHQPELRVAGAAGCRRRKGVLGVGDEFFATAVVEDDAPCFLGEGTVGAGDADGEQRRVVRQRDRRPEGVSGRVSAVPNELRRENLRQVPGRAGPREDADRRREGPDFGVGQFRGRSARHRSPDDGDVARQRHGGPEARDLVARQVVDVAETQLGLECVHDGRHFQRGRRRRGRARRRTRRRRRTRPRRPVATVAAAVVAVGGGGLVGGVAVVVVVVGALRRSSCAGAAVCSTTSVVLLAAVDEGDAATSAGAGGADEQPVGGHGERVAEGGVVLEGRVERQAEHLQVTAKEQDAAAGADGDEPAVRGDGAAEAGKLRVQRRRLLPAEAVALEDADGAPGGGLGDRAEHDQTVARRRRRRVARVALRRDAHHVVVQHRVAAEVPVHAADQRRNHRRRRRVLAAAHEHVRVAAHRRTEANRHLPEVVLPRPLVVGRL
mmetsp:Transcript_18271/g.56022  ORF Transcript_18271/g.56022 Transcript_18271/m.56022 type:complete len:976 (-) Transcript_18271:118-3045(-)